MESPKAQRSRPATRSRSSSSAAARVAVAFSLAALAIAGCGHSQAPPSSAAKPAQQRGGGGGSATQQGPQGRLSKAEYHSIEREYTHLHPLQNASDLSKAAPRAKSACSLLDKPDTRLVQLVKVDCLHAIRFFSALGGIQTATDQCTSAGCLARRYENLANALLGITRDGAGLNRELAQRGITGLCAQSIGIRQRDLTALQAAAEAATGAADAIRAGEPDVYDNYSQSLDRALAAQDPHDALAGIRAACNPTRAAPGPRTAPPTGTTPRSSPRSKPRATPRHRGKPLPRQIQPGSGLNI